VGCGGRIKAEGAAIDLDHALLPAPLAEQFQLRAWSYPQVCHLRTGLAVAVDGANPHPSIAAGFGKRRSCHCRAVAASLTAMALGRDIAEQAAGFYGVVLGHEQYQCLKVVISPANSP